MFRWLSRYVKKISVLGVGIELREIPAEEALPLLAAQPAPAPAQAAGEAEAAPPVVQKQDYVRVTGTSASSRRTPRELDLVADSDEIGFSVHQPDGSQPALWASRKALEEAFSGWKGMPESDEIAIPARTARKEEQVSFLFDESDEVEVRAG